MAENLVARVMFVAVWKQSCHIYFTVALRRKSEVMIVLRDRIEEGIKQVMKKDSDVKKKVKEISELSTWEGFIGGWLVLPLLLSGTLSSRHASLGLKFSCVGETQLAVTCLVVKFILYVCDCCWLE